MRKVSLTDATSLSHSILTPVHIPTINPQAKIYGHLTAEVLTRRAAHNFDNESLALAARLLELNPEVYTVWNFRREALATKLDAGGPEAVSLAAEELSLSEKSLGRNPKSYSAWHHRKWIVSKGLTSLEAELALVSKLLDIDERNFHAWGYRRFLVDLMGTPAERELSYAELKINQNFSNYSAWHYRTKLLPLVATGGGSRSSDSHNSSGDAKAADTNLEDLMHTTGTSKAIQLLPKQVLDTEYELVKQAFYTEPADQSAWFFHRWLLAQSQVRYTAAFAYSKEESEDREEDEKQHLMGVLGKEKEMCEQILELEPDAKWPLLTLTRLQEMLDTLLTVEEQKDSAVKGDYKVQYGVLREIDPMRRGYYKDEEEGMAKVGLHLT